MKKHKSVEEYLNDVDYSFNDYKPTKAALGFIAFIKLVEGGETENKSPIVHLNLMDKVFTRQGKLAVLCHRGFAKALSLSTILHTPTGLTTIKEVVVGDYIIGEDGKPTKVLGKSEVFSNDMYKIHLVDGRTLEVNEDHINTVIQKRTVRRDNSKYTDYQRRNLTTKELLKYTITPPRKVTSKNPKGREHKFWIPISKPVEYNYTKPEIDPYTLGLLIGDGSMDRNTGYARLHAHYDDMDFYVDNIPYNLGKRYRKKDSNCDNVGILKIGSIIKELGLNVHGNYKFIPDNYKFNSIEVRTNLLKGLMDTDGTVDSSGNSKSYCTNSEVLANDVEWLVRSLGGIAKTYYYTNEFDGYYKVSVRLNSSVFKLPRKVKRERYKSVEKVAIDKVVKMSNIESQCIAVDNESNTFIANDFIVTHNSTLLTVYLIFYIAVYGKIDNFGIVNYILLVLDSQDGGGKTVRKALEMTWNNSAFLRKYIPKARFTDIFVEFTNLDNHSLGIKITGAQQSIRGTRYTNEQGSHRPELAILDDILSDTDAKSPTVIANIENTIYKAVDKALKPSHRKIIYIGTVFNANDPLYKAIESGRWEVAAYPVCEKFPCEKKDFRGSWEDRFSYEVVKDMYDDAVAMGRMMDFNGEMMNRVMSDEDRLILDDDIIWYERGSVLTHKSRYNFYITTDFATSESDQADYSVISVFAYNNKGDWLLVDGTAKRRLMNESMDDLFRLVNIYKPLLVGIETSGQQAGFIPWVREQMVTKNIFFNLARDLGSKKEGIQARGKKIDRFLTFSPMFKSKKVWFPKELKDTFYMKELLEEISFVSFSGFKSKHDDVLDTFSMLSVLQAFKPSEEEVNTVVVHDIGDKFMIFEDIDDLEGGSTIF